MERTKNKANRFGLLILGKTFDAGTNGRFCVGLGRPGSLRKSQINSSHTLDFVRRAWFLRECRGFEEGRGYVLEKHQIAKRVKTEARLRSMRCFAGYRPWRSRSPRKGSSSEIE